MRCVRTTVWAVAFLAFAAGARAEVRNFVVAESGGGATCEAKRPPDGYLPNVDPAQLTVNVEFPSGTGPAAGDVAVSADGTTLTPAIAGDAAKAVVQGAAYKGGLHVAVDVTYKTRVLHCGNFETTPPAPASGPVSDIEAQRFLSSDNGRKELAGIQAVAGKRTILLPHLPSGRTAFPYPPSVGENDKLQAVLVADLTVPTGAIFNMDSCPDRDPFRILGDFSALAAKKQALRAGGAPAPAFAVVAVGPAFECGAGKIVYTAAQAAAADASPPLPPSTTLRVRPVYHLAATFIYGFDFQSQSTFSIHDAKIVSQEDKVGSSLDVGFTWFPGGVDYEHMKTRNYWLNPFLVFDLTAPTENFASGLALTVSGGISVAVGASFHKSTVLDGMSVGDPFTGDGTVPTRKVWNSKSVGFFVGIALDSAVFGKVKGLWGATSH